MTRRKWNAYRPPALSVSQILDWADEFHRRRGLLPSCLFGVIPRTGSETWRRVDAALRRGRRGLSGVSSLARLLHEHRGVRTQSLLPRLTLPLILAWAAAHF